MKTQFRIMAGVIGLVVSGAVAAAGVTTNPGSTAGTQGTGGQVQFTGSIEDTSCNVTSASANRKVDLGKWTKSYFTGSKIETTKTPFHINVDNCPGSVKLVAVLFDGNKDQTDPSLLAINTGTGNATGVGIKLYEENQSTQVALGSVTAKHPVTAGASGNGSADLIFYADYESTGTAVTTGNANATADFNMVYN